MAGLLELVLGNPRPLAQLGVGLVLLLVSAFVLAANRRRPANVAFAAFVGLVGLNYVFGYATSLLAGAGPIELFYETTSGERLAQWPYRADALPWAALATTFLIFDPFALLIFVGHYPERNAFSRPLVLLPALAVTSVFAAVNVARPSSFLSSSAWHSALVAWYSLAYAVALLALLRRAAHADPDSIRGRQLRLVAAGYAVAILTRLALVPSELLDVPLRVLYAGVPFGVALLAVLWLGALAYLRHEAPPRAYAELRGTWRAMTVWVVGIGALWLVQPIVANLSDDVTALGALGALAEVTWLSSYAVRWFVFAGVVTYALLRYQVFDLDLKLKRGFLVATTLALGAVAFIAAYVTLADAFGGTLTATVTVGQLASVGLALAVIVPLFRVARGLTERIFPGITAEDAAYVRARKLEVYRAALEPLARDEAIDDARLADLARLRRRLGVTAAEHDAILVALRASSAPRRAPGTTRPGDVVLGRYRVDSVLGSGATGRTFLAHDLIEARDVALKEIVSDGLDGERAALTALREAKSVAEIRHPNVLAIESAERVGQSFYLVMEHATGGSLKDRLRRGPLEPATAVAIARGVLEGLAEVHARGIVHRDVKPANVLFAAGGVPKLADFGVARVPDLSETLTSLEDGFQPGTPYYMAPEQIEGGAIGAAADAYAVAAMLYECVAGRPYLDFDGLDLHRVRERILKQDPRLPLPGASAELNRALARGLAKLPEARYADARAFAAALADTPEGRGERRIVPAAVESAETQRSTLN